MMPVFPSSSSPIQFDDHVTKGLSATSDDHNKVSEVDNSVYNSNNSDRAHTIRETNELSAQVISGSQDDENKSSNNNYHYKDNFISIRDELLNETNETSIR